MLRIVFIPLLFSTFLISSPMYTVRLAVFDLYNESRLTHTINAFSPALKNTVRTYKKGGFIYAHTVPTVDKSTLKKLLPAYQKVFSDAYISSTQLP